MARLYFQVSNLYQNRKSNHFRADLNSKFKGQQITTSEKTDKMPKTGLCC